MANPSTTRWRRRIGTSRSTQFHSSSGQHAHPRAAGTVAGPTGKVSAS